MVAAPRGEPLGRTPRLARWPAARVISLDDSVAKMATHSRGIWQAMLINLPHAKPASMLDAMRNERTSSGKRNQRPYGACLTSMVAGSSPAGVIEFSSLPALPFYPLAGDSSVGPFSIRTRRPGRQLVAWHEGRGTGRA